MKQIAPQRPAINRCHKRGVCSVHPTIHQRLQHIPRTYPVERNAVLLQDGGRNEGHLVAEKSIAALRASWKKPCRDIKKRNVTTGTLYPVVI